MNKLLVFSVEQFPGLFGLTQLGLQSSHSCEVFVVLVFLDVVLHLTHAFLMVDFEIRDGLTKTSAAAHDLLIRFISLGTWKLVYDEHFMSARKRAQRGLDIFDEPHGVSE